MKAHLISHKSPAHKLRLHFEECSTLLPLPARNALIIAAQADPRGCVGESPLRTLALEEAIARVRRYYPQFFRS